MYITIFNAICISTATTTAKQALVSTQKSDDIRIKSFYASGATRSSTLVPPDFFTATNLTIYEYRCVYTSGI